MSSACPILSGTLPDGKSERIAITGGRLTVGRQGDILLPHSSVSRAHAAIERREEGWFVSDLGSRNGTFVNGISVQRRLLVPGDVISFGCVKLRFEFDGEVADDAETCAMTFESLAGLGMTGAVTALVGRSEALQSAMRLAIRAAKSDATVLVFGESGTGKELFARLIYEESRRKSRKFLAVNCSAIEQSLLGSTLFGHEKGAFTGADRQKKGLFEEANGGTIFLDEIGELTHDMQVKLLRVLQEGEFMRVGGTETVKVDVRVITATNRDLAKAVKDGRFREDLYYRLNVIQIHLPPLRERTGDIEDLVKHYVTELGGPSRTISPGAMSALCAYSWPGNVRELRNTIERMVVLGGDRLDVDDLPSEIATGGMPVGPAASSGQSLADVERSHIMSVLEMSGGNKCKAAQLLGLSRSALYEKLKKYEIE
jgi:transcriptional regulator with PAS, ATPase and Fis domain